MHWHIFTGYRNAYQAWSSFATADNAADALLIREAQNSAFGKEFIGQCDDDACPHRD